MVDITTTDIDTGTEPNDGTGTSARSGGAIINDNFNNIKEALKGVSEDTSGHSDNLARIRSQHLVFGGAITSIELPLLLDENGTEIPNTTYSVGLQNGGALPAWLSVDTTNPSAGNYGSLTGTPTGVGTTNLIYYASIQGGEVHTQGFAISVSAPVMQITASYGVSDSAALPASPTEITFTGTRVELPFEAITSKNYYVISIPNFTANRIYNKLIPSTGLGPWQVNGGIISLQSMQDFDATIWVIEGVAS